MFRPGEKSEQAPGQFLDRPLKKQVTGTQEHTGQAGELGHRRDHLKDGKYSNISQPVKVKCVLNEGTLLVSVPLVPPLSRPPAPAATADSGSQTAARPVEAPPLPTLHCQTRPSGRRGSPEGGKANQMAGWGR